MKLGCIITNRRVKLSVWLGNFRYDPWLRNSEVNRQPVRLRLHFFWDMKAAILVHFTPKGETVNSQDFCRFGPMKEALRRFLSSEKSLALCKIG
jgi:hypothetical protein